MSILCDILVSVAKISTSIPGGMAELVDAADLKSVEGNTSWEFKSPYPHDLQSLVISNFHPHEALCLSSTYALYFSLSL